MLGEGSKLEIMWYLIRIGAFTEAFQVLFWNRDCWFWQRPSKNFYIVWKDIRYIPDVVIPAGEFLLVDYTREKSIQKKDFMNALFGDGLHWIEVRDQNGKVIENI